MQRASFCTLRVFNAPALLAWLPAPTAPHACPPCTVQVRIVKHAFEIVHLLTDQNPVQVVVDAIINR